MGRVAIVEDDEDTREVFKLTLQDGHEFLTFASGQKFLKVFRPSSFDLILLDLAMPEMNGLRGF